MGIYIYIYVYVYVYTYSSASQTKKAPCLGALMGHKSINTTYVGLFGFVVGRWKLLEVQALGGPPPGNSDYKE